MATQTIPRITEDEYLRLERAAEEKSEFIGEEIFVMPSRSLRHSRIIGNTTMHLGFSLRNTAFSLFPDTRVRTPVSGSFVYPDISIVSGNPVTYKGGPDNLINPAVIIEVLSASTADYDHGKKFELYREIPTFADYILVHTESALVEHFARQPEASWLFREHRGLESELTIPSLNCTIKVAEVYAGVFEIPE
ncbi:MAG TPA: Uma2 family endonuclease [Bryobacteraceae bacterium]